MVKVQSHRETVWPAVNATVSNNSVSMFSYETLAANSPQYCAIQQGIQRTDRSGSTGTWS